jgi:anti-sigma factor RsiW
VRAVEHAYIDEHSIAERYISRRLKPEEREEFEQHLVECQECADRIVLANMFRARQLNGIQCAEQAVASKPAVNFTHHSDDMREPAALVVRVKPQQLLWAIGISLLALGVIVFAVLKLFSN